MKASTLVGTAGFAPVGVQLVALLAMPMVPAFEAAVLWPTVVSLPAISCILFIGAALLKNRGL